MPKLNRIPAGARAATPVDKLARDVVKQRVRAAVYYWERVAKRDSPRVEDIHQLRVWSRRAMAGVQLFESRLSAEPAAELKRMLNKARKRAGRARDCDVLVATLDKRSRALLADALKELQKGREETSERLRRSYRKKVKSGVVRDLLKSLPKRSESSGQNGKARTPLPFGPWFKEQFEDSTAEFRKHLRTSRPSERGIHPLRIAGKQVRYALEIGLPSLPKAAGKQLYAALEQLQEHLGEICDHLALAEQYRSLAQELKPKQRARIVQAADKHAQQARTGRTKFTRWWSGAAGRKKLLRLLAAVLPQRETPSRPQRRKSHEK